MPYNNQWATAISIGLPIGAGCYWASAHATWGTNLRQAGLWLALGGGVVGAWLGFHATGGLMALATALVGGAVGANLALVVLSIATDRNQPARVEESDYARALAGADHRS